MLALRLPHLVVDNVQVLVQIPNIRLQVKRFLEYLLTVWRCVVHVRIAHHLSEKPIVLSFGELVCRSAHLLWEYRIKFIFNGGKLVQKCALLQFDVVQLLHVPFVRILYLACLFLDSLDLSERLDQHELIVAQT